MPQLITQSLRLYRYALPMRRPVHLKQGILKERQGLILQAQNEAGQWHWGEVAPFPGLHHESLPDCVRQLQEVDLNSVDLRGCFPSVAWGLEMLRQPLHPPLQKRRPVEARPQLTLNALLTEPENQDLDREAHSLYQAGYRCFKLKVGLRDPQRDLQRIQLIQQSFPDVTLRLDANRSWSLAQAQNFIERLPLQGIEYLEEPLKQPADYARLAPRMTELKCALALDESLWEKQWKAYATYAQTLVLKPMRMGPTRLAECCIWAQKNRRQLVFSSVFESDLGLRYLALKAAQEAGTDSPHGLDTWRAFEHNLIDPGFQSSIKSREKNPAQINLHSKLFTAPPQLRYAYLDSV